MTAALDRFTFSSSDMWLSEFDLPPADAAWQRVNTTSSGYALIAFPRTSLVIAQQGRPEVVADPTRAMLYPPSQPYRRRPVSAAGDQCSALAITLRLAADAALPFDPRAADPDTYRFPFPAAAMATSDYELAQRIRRIVVGVAADADSIHEELYWLVARVVANGYRNHGSRATRGHLGTSDAQAQVVEDVRAVIGRDLAERQSLADLASGVGVSQFHLARLFRANTGRSINSYRTELRLRASLAPIADGEPLADVALRMGFASQSHLTDRFTRAYGVSPHRWRLALRQGGSKLSTIVKEGNGARQIA